MEIVSQLKGKHVSNHTGDIDMPKTHGDGTRIAEDRKHCSS